MIWKVSKRGKGIPTIWSHHLAYAVGLITADGSLSTDGRHIDFTSKDESLVRTFRECLGISNTIGKKISGHTGRRDYFRVQFGDVVFYHWLEGLGLMKRKSRSLGALKIPGPFFFDFVRGCFDGDGTIYSFWDRRWADSFMFYVAFASGSRPFLQWLQERMIRHIGIRGHIAAGNRQACGRKLFGTQVRIR